MTKIFQSAKNFFTTFRNTPMQLVTGFLLGIIASWSLVSNQYTAHLTESSDKQIEHLEVQQLELKTENQRLLDDKSRLYSDFSSRNKKLLKENVIQKAKLQLLEEMKKRQDSKSKLEAALVVNAYPDKDSEIISPLEISAIEEMKVKISKLRVEISDMENCIRLEMYPTSRLVSYKCTELSND